MRCYLIATCLITTLNIQAVELDTAIVEIEKSEIESTAPWISFPSIKTVENKARARLISELNINESMAKKVSAYRVYTSDWYQVAVEEKSYIIDRDAKYWMSGESVGNIFLFQDGIAPVNVNNEVRESLITISGLAKRWPGPTAIYPSTNNNIPLKKVFIFMDLSCPFCKEFHLTKRESLQQKGYEIVYLPFVRDVDDKKIKSLHERVFCLNDQNAKDSLITQIYLNGIKSAPDTSSLEGCNIIDKTFFNTLAESGARYNLTGTPLFITESGGVFYGYSAFSQHALR